MNLDSIQKLAMYQQNPELIKAPTVDELVDLFLQVIDMVRNTNEAIREGKLKGDDGYTPQPDTDYLSLTTARSILDDFIRNTAFQNERETRIRLDALDREMEKRLAKLKNGKDAQISERDIEETKRRVLADLPDLSLLITREPTAIRDALELLEGDERLEQSAIRDLEDTIKGLRKDIDKRNVYVPVGAAQTTTGGTGTGSVTKSDVGLGNVDNTSDANKPISAATQAALDLKANISSLAPVATSGDYEDLDNKPDLSAFDNVDTFATLSAFPTTGASDIFYIATDTGLVYRWTGSTYAQISGGLALGETSATAYRGDRGKTAYDHTLRTDNPHAVTKAQVGLDSVDNTADANKNVLSATKLTTARTINGVSFNGTANITVADSTKVPTTRTVNGKALSGDISLTASDVGLGNVNNTSDANKPISTATQTALNAKASLTGAETLTNKRINPRVTSTASTTTLTPSVANEDMNVITALAGNLTINAPTGTPTNGQSLLLRIKDNGTSRSLTWDPIYRAVGVTVSTATTAGEVLYVGMKYNADASKWDILASST